MTWWFTADEHIEHDNIRHHCARQFSSAWEMWCTIRERHNERVQPEDTVYHLGDFCWSSAGNRVGEYLQELTGRHVLVAGNHDRCHPAHKGAEKWKRRYLAAGFEAVHERLIVYHPEIPRGALLCHFPPNDQDVRYSQWRPTFHDLGSLGWLICGHVHEKWLRRACCVNVGVDQWGFAPVSVEELGARLRAWDADPELKEFE